MGVLCRITTKERIYEQEAVIFEGPYNSLVFYRLGGDRRLLLVHGAEDNKVLSAFLPIRHFYGRGLKRMGHYCLKGRFKAIRGPFCPGCCP